jgi:hypothetical protein
MKRALSLLAAASLFASGSLACNVVNGGSQDPAVACTDLCTTSGFASGRAEVFAHEVNCFCAGGNAGAQVAAGACAETCTDLGWNTGEAFSASACQCSN